MKDLHSNFTASSVELNSSTPLPNHTPSPYLSSPSSLSIYFTYTIVFISLTSLVLFLIALIGIRVQFGGHLPIYEGTRDIFGIDGEVVIRRMRVMEGKDHNAVVEITAKSDRDLWFGQGYAAASSRLFQMEMLRRVGHGRLSEVVGEDGLELDKVTPWITFFFELIIRSY